MSSSGSFTHRFAITRVNGFGFGVDRDIYALAFRNSDAQLVIESYEVESDMQITLLDSSTDLSPSNTLGATAKIKIASFDKEGVLIALQADLAIAKQRLEVWSFDESTTSSKITPNKIASEIVLQDGLHALSRIPNDEAEGDFLLVPGTYVQDGIRVQNWRSAPRN